jgi:hypothetical protein
VTEHHLATRLGKAIESAFQGDLDIQYTNEGTIVRVCLLGGVNLTYCQKGGCLMSFFLLESF